MINLPRLGLGGHTFISKPGSDPPISDDRHQAVIEALGRARGMGLAAVALSPFVRGWKLDALGSKGIDRSTAAEGRLDEPCVREVKGWAALAGLTG